ncbi:MAG: polymerase sigma factor, sigma-70 family [Phycisphaerales bacterium]|nr:polymerase sigma factor, sigma-70 family [Phycisphaerales bacterium]
MPGDRDPWRELLARHGPGLVLFARQWVSSATDAEDAVQDGFIRFWQARSRARADVGYLYACVRTAAMDLSRSGHRREKREAAFGAPARNSVPAFSPEHAELASAVEASLAKLPPEQREVIVMKIWGGLTFSQIARAAGIGVNTAASRYRYALERLERELSKEVARD